MRLTEKKERTMKLDQYEGAVADSAVAEAADLLYHILDTSYACSGNCLETEVNGTRTTLQSLYWSCKELLERTAALPEKTGFLAMSALEQTWKLAKPLCLLPLDECMASECHDAVYNARRLEQILKDDEYKAIWREKSDSYLAILEMLGFDTDGLDFSDLTGIMDPLLSALSFYAEKSRPGIHMIRDGAPSGVKSPAIATAICRYSSEKELADAVMGSGKDALLAFGAIEKTHRQVKDYFYEWQYGIPEERQRNFMQHDHLTTDEYLDMPCDYTRRIYLAVKDGQRLYLVLCPWKGDTYSRIGEQKYEYYYGKRASYAPYQVFYQDMACAPGGATILAVKKDGYPLSGLMDSLSKAWLPAFLQETITYFFGGGAVEAGRAYLPEEAVAETEAPGSGRCRIVPVCSGLPAAPSYAYQVPWPKDVFTGSGDGTDVRTGLPLHGITEAQADAAALWLASYLKLSPDDIREAPILPSAMGSGEEYKKHMDGQVKKAYVRAISLRLAGVTGHRWQVRQWCLDRLLDRQYAIIQDALDHKLQGFTKIEIAGEPLFAKDGRPLMRWDSRRRAQVQVKSSIDIDDTRESRSLQGSMAPRVFWASPETKSKPAVVLKIRPTSSAQYGLLLGTDPGNLPEMLRLSAMIEDFLKCFSGWLPRSLTNSYAATSRSIEAQCLEVPCMAAVNICMNRKTWDAANKKATEAQAP